ncbi:MAG: 50S ribosomal protein L29 [Deltaproteobacteria bacterium]|nr:50S ribosomal protein L29 [Deltaproteobacteria bacterium]MBW1812202.1 50S ribosomal protein L29 [Deltaproteobacteria bacterium]MBW1845704.1 50S ribosomal protein L29 [Deltaproteobacteria bacterium]MBW1983162.1 50S ribosomal protein L29 [Deltaproteobacteria bacterium]MBW2363590.1 50S ribosomal protein L29 [Deltaproteobacteria bacterium]
MKANDIRGLSKDEMMLKVNEMKEELFNLRFQNTVGQLENQQKMKKTKRDIARIKTIMNEHSKAAITEAATTEKE